MKNYLIVSSAILMSINYGCSNSVTKQNNATSQTQQTEALKETAHQHSENDSIGLNNGAKWKVVPEMLKHIRKMESDIAVFTEGKHTEIKDFTQLGESLQKNIDLLTSNCSMEGPAHDELHKWLVPFIELSKKFDLATDVTEQKKIHQELKASFETFNTYFE